MKKILVILIFTIILSMTTVNARSTRWYVDQKPLLPMSADILEEMEHKIDANGNLEEIILSYTISEECDLEKITITPNVFYSISNYSYLMPNQKVNITMNIKNNASSDYQFVKESLIVSTDNITRLGTNYNFSLNSTRGFDGQAVSELFFPYRTMNSALKSLFKAELIQFSESELNEKLRAQGYLGISELHLYYMDFYNQKYHLQEEKLENFTDSIIKEIFDGPRLNQKEMNPYIIELGYDFYYNKILLLELGKEKASLGSYMREGIDNSYFDTKIGRVKQAEMKQLNDIYITTDEQYLVDNFSYYNLSGYIGFQLMKVPVLDVEVEEFVIPPDTGVN